MPPRGAGQWNRRACTAAVVRAFLVVVMPALLSSRLAGSDGRPLMAASQGFRRTPARSLRPPRSRQRVRRYNFAPIVYTRVTPILDDVRFKAGLGPLDPPEPAWRGPFRKQAEAVDYRNKLIDLGEYSASQLGLFAEEFSVQGQRRFFVKTFAGFVTDLALRGPGSHFHEILLEDRPCWLYFDLEFSKPANPHLDGSAVIEQFRQILASFCAHHDLPFDEALSVYLDSSTDVKFSSHVIVKAFAFHNNAQAGRFVEMLVEYARGLRGSDSGMDLFFVREDPDDPEATTTVIDTAVYTRNRCFRVLNQSKFGKTAILQLQDGGSVVHPSDTAELQLLMTLASFVPSSTPLWENPLIPSDLKHRPTGIFSSVDMDGKWKLFTDWLIQEWDALRDREEGLQSHVPTYGKIFLTKQGTYSICLENNRYCCNRGRSHKSNGIFFEVDLQQRMFRQACFDKSDCKGQRTRWRKVPAKVTMPEPAMGQFNLLV